jgi:hypothetical protein
VHLSHEAYHGIPKTEKFVLKVIASRKFAAAYTSSDVTVEDLSLGESDRDNAKALSMAR